MLVVFDSASGEIIESSTQPSHDNPAAEYRQRDELMTRLVTVEEARSWEGRPITPPWLQPPPHK